MAKNRWGAIVKLEEQDDWTDALKKIADPWIEIHEEGAVLRSASFDGLATAEFVKDRALILIDVLNGAMAATRGVKPIQFNGAVIQFTSDGRKHRTVLVEAGFLALSGMRANVQVTGPDGKPKSLPASKPSEAQNWIKIAEGDEQLANALIYFGRANNWFDIYKCLECLILKFGAGKGKNFLALNWADKGEIKRLMRTANSIARHAKGKYRPPSNPMQIKDARELTASLLRRAFAEARLRINP